MVGSRAWSRKSYAQKAAARAQDPPHFLQSRVEVQVVQDCDHSDQIDAGGYIAQLSRVHRHVQQASATGRGCLLHLDVSINPADGVEMLRESDQQFPTPATDVQCIVSLVRESGDDPCVEGIVVTPRVTGIQIPHASGEPTTAPVPGQTADIHSSSLADQPWDAAS